MSEPIQVGGSYTCKQCGEWTNVADMHTCDTKQDSSVFPATQATKLGELDDLYAKLRDNGWLPVELFNPNVPIVLYSPPERLYSEPQGKLPDIRIAMPRDWTWATHGMPLRRPTQATIALSEQEKSKMSLEQSYVGDCSACHAKVVDCCNECERCVECCICYGEINPRSNRDPSVVKSVSHHTEAVMEAAEEIVGPYQGTVECPWCSKHPHLDPCTFECASARKEKQEHDRAIANSAAIISKQIPSVSVEAREQARRIISNSLSMNSLVGIPAFELRQLEQRIAALTDRDQSIRRQVVEKIRAQAEEYRAQAERWQKQSEREPNSVIKELCYSVRDSSLNKTAALFTFAIDVESMSFEQETK